LLSLMVPALGPSRVARNALALGATSKRIAFAAAS